MSTATAPIEIGQVRLVVNDLPRMVDFYTRTLGLQKLSSDGTDAVLGADATPLVTLRGDARAAGHNPRAAGLFHTAFLMPDRAALARWLIHAAESRVPLQGASDHHVSEAIYLADPEGNGIEVYVDRPRSRWTDAQGGVVMTTEALDLNALARAADRPWTGAPTGLVIGHVHLQVGNVAQAQAFYAEKLGFAVTAQYPGAAFYGSGGYHHHLATNIWNSRGAGPRAPSTGLDLVELRLDASEAARLKATFEGARTVADPWGTRFALNAKADAGGDHAG